MRTKGERCDMELVITARGRGARDYFAPNLPMLVAVFDAEHRSKIQTFFQGKVKNFRGGPRNWTRHESRMLDIDFLRRSISATADTESIHW